MLVKDNMQFKATGHTKQTCDRCGHALTIPFIFKLSDVPFMDVAVHVSCYQAPIPLGAKK